MFEKYFYFSEIKLNPSHYYFTNMLLVWRKILPVISIKRNNYIFTNILPSMSIKLDGQKVEYDYRLWSHGSHIRLFVGL